MKLKITRNNFYKTRFLQYSEDDLMEGLDLVVMDLEYERNSEISIAIFENSSFLPHDPLATVKIQLKDLIHKCENKTFMENEISKVFFNLKKKVILRFVNWIFLVQNQLYLIFS